MIPKVKVICIILSSVVETYVTQIFVTGTRLALFVALHHALPSRKFKRKFTVVLKVHVSPTFESYACCMHLKYMHVHRLRVQA